MIKTFVNAWKVADIRKKLLFTAFVILVFRIGSVIPVPFLNIVDEINVGKGNTILTYLSLMTGSAFTYGTIFAMSITPYINASIIMQLLAVAIPALERLQKEGEEGRKKIGTITRFVTVGLGLLQSLAYFFFLRANGYLMKDASGAAFTGFDAVFQAVVIIAVLTAGTAVIMWLGEQITISGIGNGISIILFAGIVSRFPTLIKQLFQYLDTGRTVYKVLVPVVCVIFLLMIAYIVFMDNSERRLPIQYAKRVVGRKVYGGQNTNLPIKVAMSGVMPIIFAQSICSLPATICAFTGKTSGWWYDHVWSSSSWIYAVIYFIMIFFFSWFYSTIQYDTVEISNNLKSNGGFIPGFRPGKPTADFIQKVINKIIVFGSVYLGIVALLPIIAGNLMEGVKNLAIGGTSVIIVVGVALETVKALEAQMLMRHYKGFLD